MAPEDSSVKLPEKRRLSDHAIHADELMRKEVTRDEHRPHQAGRIESRAWA